MDSEPPPEVSRPLLRIALELAAREPADPGLQDAAAALQRICRAAVSALPLSGAAVHLMPDVNHDVIGAVSAESARSAADIAFTVGEGPPQLAYFSRRPVLVPDVAADLERWPGYVARAQEVGLAGVYSLPLHLGATCFGVLDLFTDRTVGLDRQQLALGITFAQAAVLTLLEAADAEAFVGGGPGAEGADGDGLVEAFDHQPEVHQAQGVVSVDLGISVTEALLRMRGRAFGAGVTLSALARRIVEGTEDPRSWNADPPRVDSETVEPS